MVLFRRFVLMLQFLTTLPLPFNLNVKEEDFGKGLIFAPAVGLIIGGFLSALYYVLIMVFPNYVSIVLILTAYIILTGGLHLDGLGDTFDGLFSNRSRERMLEIMRDSRIGTNGVLAIVSVLALNVAALSSIDPGYILKALLLMPVAGRIGSLISSSCCSYARRDEGLGKSFIDHCGLKEILIGTVIYAVIFAAVGGLSILYIAAVPAISAFITSRLFSSRIGGATGDILGAVCELNQTLFLLMLVLLQQLGFM